MHDCIIVVLCIKIKWLSECMYVQVTVPDVVLRINNVSIKVHFFFSYMVFLTLYLPDFGQR